MSGPIAPQALPLGRHLQRAALVATLAPLFVLGSLGLWQYQRDVASVEAFAGSESIAAARVAANVLDFLVDDTRTLLQQIADDLARGDIGETRLSRLGRTQRQTEGLEITDARGVILVSSIGQKGRNVSGLRYFIDAREGAAIAYSDVFYSKWLEQNVVMIAVPYRRAGAFQGVVMARLHLRELHKILVSRLDDLQLRNTLITDRAGTLIAHPDFKQVANGVNLKSMPPVAAALAGRSGWLRYEVPGDPEVHISGYLPMTGTGWAIIASRRGGQNVLDAGARLQLQLLLAGLAAFLAALSAAAWGRRLAKPLEALEGVIRMGQAARSTGGPAPSVDVAQIGASVREYQTLAEGYNALAAAINAQFDEILALQKAMQTKNAELNTQNEELKALSEAADASNKLKSQFLANMSHELRTPLNSIIGYTVLTLTDEEQALSDQNRHNLETVERNGRHLLALINGILDLSKVESGRATVFIEAFDPRALVADVVEVLRPLADERQVKLILGDGPALPHVESDLTKVRQIVMNLVANAIKFTPAGGWVDVSLGRRGPGRFTIDVCDSGVGIAPEQQEVVFEAFRQVDGSATRTAGGTGLGLSIARELARLLGGEISLESAPGEGSTFTVELPLRQASAMPSAGAGSQNAAQPSGPSEALVLAIDDDAQTLYLTIEQFKGTPYLLVPTTNVDAGLELAKRLRPDAILLDLKIRRADDWRVLRALKAAPETAAVPVVALSFESERALAQSLGAADHLPKPLEREALVATFARILARRPGPSPMKGS